MTHDTRLEGQPVKLHSTGLRSGIEVTFRRIHLHLQGSVHQSIGWRQSNFQPSSFAEQFILDLRDIAGQDH